MRRTPRTLWPFLSQLLNDQPDWLSAPPGALSPQALRREAVLTALSAAAGPLAMLLRSMSFPYAEFRQRIAKGRVTACASKGTAVARPRITWTCAQS